MIFGAPYDLVSIVIGVAGLVIGSGLSVLLYKLNGNVSFQARMERSKELRESTLRLLVDRTDLPEVHLVNADRYERDYDGEWRTTRRGELLRRAELMDARHNGVELVDEVVSTWVDGSGRRTLRPTARPAANVLKVGFVPYGQIEFINELGTERSGAPQLFVTFRGPGRSPFSYFTYHEEVKEIARPSGRPYFVPVDELGRTKTGRLFGLVGLGRRLHTQRRMEASARRLRANEGVDR